MVLSRARTSAAEHVDTLAEADQVKIAGIYCDVASRQIALGFPVAAVAKQLRGVTTPSSFRSSKL